jgi:hypothetical protein
VRDMHKGRHGHARKGARALGTGQRSSWGQLLFFASVSVAAVSTGSIRLLKLMSRPFAGRFGISPVLRTS